MSQQFLRTPDERFAALPDFAYEPAYVEGLPGYEPMRMAYIDTGPRDAEVTALCLHGQPTWSFLYRRMIPVFESRGVRVVAPDLFGFGRSDKPMEESVYGYNFHRNALLAFIRALDLRNILLVVQDWGGLLGLSLPMTLPDRIRRLLIMNTALPIGVSPGKGFDDWKAYSAANPDLDIAGLMGRAVPLLSTEEQNAYAAPYPDQSYKAGVRRFPEMVMVAPHMEGVDLARKSRSFLSTAWAGDSFMAVGMLDPVLGPPVMSEVRSFIRNCPEPMDVAEGGHFLQEHGGPVAEAALDRFGL